MSELFPTRALSIEVVSCTEPAREAEFLHWFINVRMPDLKQIPGIIDVYLYRDIQYDFGEIGASFMAWKDELVRGVRQLILCRINSNEPWALMQRVREDDKQRMVQGRIPDCYKSYELGVWEFLFTRKSILPPVRPPTNLPDGMPKHIFLGVFSTREITDYFWEHCLHIHYHDIVQTPGLVAVSRFRTANPNPGEEEPRGLAINEYDCDDPGAAMGQIIKKDHEVWGPAGRLDEKNIGPLCKSYATGMFEHVDIV